MKYFFFLDPPSSYEAFVPCHVYKFTLSFFKYFYPVLVSGLQESDPSSTIVNRIVWLSAKIRETEPQGRGMCLKAENSGRMPLN